MHQCRAMDLHESIDFLSEGECHLVRCLLRARDSPGSASVAAIPDTFPSHTCASTRNTNLFSRSDDIPVQVSDPATPTALGGRLSDDSSSTALAKAFWYVVRVRFCALSAIDTRHIQRLFSLALPTSSYEVRYDQSWSAAIDAHICDTLRVHDTTNSNSI